MSWEKFYNSLPKSPLTVTCAGKIFQATCPKCYSPNYLNGSTPDFLECQTCHSTYRVK